MRRLVLLLPLALLLPAAAEEKPLLNNDLAEPVRIEAKGGPIDVEVGHATPCVADLDRDGKPDLLVGQFGGGKVRYYRNVGEKHAPKFDDYEFIKAGTDDAAVPVG